ncbi:GNAT family N-acetyltransferase [Clostridium aciditolerans]|uniref:GNAT family N-acetyltransferase n=1 Tax=Clostridium aciditolerans TaxID=339861 RepID=A0A934M0I7_9CLOT|nr:GNAT family N-acetyltransferase [Clostridium aciditolerans]MBI6872204.1 GNAT family N-acetyltransferase [Clostridium aciditolerans]
MYKIYKIDPINLTDKEAGNLYLINKNIVKKYNLLGLFKDINSYKDLFLSTFNEIDNELFVLKKDSLICGILNCIKSADWSGKEQYKLSVSLCDSIIDESMLKSIDELVQEKLNRHGELAVVTYNNELEKLVKKHTSKVNLKANYYTLKKEDIDIDLINKSIKEFEARNADLSIKYTNIISDEHIQQYCDLFMETMEDMTDVNEDGYVPFVITPEKQRQINSSNKENNITHHCYMIFNSNNEMIAKSNVRVSNNNPRFPYQFMIGVKRQYRGRSLGKWLYASMYKRLFESVDFEKVLVCHHPENKPAINISEWIGYKFNYLETIHILYK